MLAISIGLKIFCFCHLAHVNVVLTLCVALPITALLSLVLIVIVRWLDRAECDSSRLYLWAVLLGILASTALAPRPIKASSAQLRAGAT